MPRRDALDERLQRTVDSLSTALLARRLGRSATTAFPAGHAALALAHHVYERARPGRGHGARAAHHLERSVAALSERPYDPMLYGGFTGVAWVLEHVRGDGDGDRAAAVDEALAEYLGSPTWDEPFDLISGLVGYGVYALERLPRPSARALLEQVVHHLSATAVRTGPGLAWRSRSKWVAEGLRTRSDEGWNLGLAHGIPGVIALLGRVVRAGVATAEASRLLDGAVAWLLSLEAPRGSPSAFAYGVHDGVGPAPARAAWCYGDPGVAAALLLAAKASGERTWSRAALRIGVRAARRDPDSCGVMDGSLCHGAAGLAHIFRRLHAQTDDPRFAVASRAWLARAIDLRTADGVDGYRSYSLVPREGEPRMAWRADPSFLTGTAGIDVALASSAEAATGGGWASWDCVLLLSDCEVRASG